MEVQEIQEKLISILKSHVGDLKITAEESNKFEVAGTIEVMQGKKKVDGVYFCTVVPKPKDVRFYFFPLYTHADQLDMSPALKKCLKGKTCFHFKSLDDSLETEVKGLVDSAISLYKAEGML